MKKSLNWNNRVLRRSLVVVTALATLALPRMTPALAADPASTSVTGCTITGPSVSGQTTASFQGAVDSQISVTVNFAAGTAAYDTSGPGGSNRYRVSVRFGFTGLSYVNQTWTVPLSFVDSPWTIDATNELFYEFYSIDDAGERVALLCSYTIKGAPSVSTKNFGKSDKTADAKPRSREAISGVSPAGTKK